MRQEGLSEAVVAAFGYSYMELVNGASGTIPESAISGVSTLPNLDTEIKGVISPNPLLLQETVVLKLNGGLGTSMGLDKAKSLLVVKGTDTFLDLTAKQVITMRKQFKLGVKFMLMNSFNTSVDTLNFMTKYSSISEDQNLKL